MSFTRFKRLVVAFVGAGRQSKFEMIPVLFFGCRIILIIVSVRYGAKVVSACKRKLFCKTE